MVRCLVAQVPRNFIRVWVPKSETEYLQDMSFKRSAEERKFIWVFNERSFSSRVFIGWPQKLIKIAGLASAR